MIRVGIAEDKADLRRNLGQIIQLIGDLELCLVAQNGQEVLDYLDADGSKPEVILMDIDMPELDGISATGVIKKKWPEIKIVMLTVFDQHNKIFEALRNGADGYLLKGERPKVILDAIQDVMENKLPMSPSIAQQTLSFFRNLPKSEDQKSPEDFNLTTRELEILEELSTGLTYKEVAEKLFISSKTVRSHTDNIYKKLGVHSKVEAGNVARKNRWFSGE